MELEIANRPFPRSKGVRALVVALGLLCFFLGCSQEVDQDFKEEKLTHEQLTEILNTINDEEGEDEAIKLLEHLGFIPVDHNGSINDRAPPLACLMLPSDEGNQQGVGTECCQLSQDQWGCWPKPTDQPDSPE